MQRPKVDPGSDSAPDDATQESGSHVVVTDGQADMSASAVTIVIGVLMFVVFLVTIDGAMVTALPTIVVALDSPSGYTWIASAYLLGLTALLPVWGTLSDIWGRKPLMLAACALLAAGSLISGIAPNMTVLLVGRVIQGMGGGGMLILVNIIISDLFDIRDRAKYLGFVSATWALGCSFGPLIGAAFAQDATWRWYFYFNLPIVGTGFVLLTLFLKVHNPQTPLVRGLQSIDVLGITAIVGSSVMLLLGLQMGGVSRPWSSPTIICLLVFALVTAVVFVFVEWRVASQVNRLVKPVIHLGLFGHRSRVVILLVSFLHGLMLTVPFFYLPLFFQVVLAAPPVLSAVWLLPLGFATTFSAAAVGAVTKRTGHVVAPMLAGMALSALGFGLLSNLSVRVDWARIIMFQLVVGAGLGPNTYTPIVALQRLVETRDVAAATATLGFVRQLGCALSAVLGGAIIQGQFAEMAARFRQADQLLDANVFSSIAFVASLPPDEKDLFREILTWSMRPVWYFYCVVAGLGLVLTMFIDRSRLTTSIEAVAEKDQGRTANAASLRYVSDEETHDHGQGTKSWK